MGTWIIFWWPSPFWKNSLYPATFFVTTQYIGGEREFWWDELEQLILMPGQLPQSLHFNIGGVEFRFKFSEYHHYSVRRAADYKDWKVTYDGSPPPTERHALFLKLWEKLQGSSEPSRRSMLQYLFDWAGRGPLVRPTHRPMKQDELTKTIAGGLVEIGSHCVTHGSLTTMGTYEKSSEINESKMRLESILDSSIRSLAYPHGEYNREICELTRQAGYQCAVGTTSYQVDDFDKHFQLRRQPAADVPGVILRTRLLD